MTKKIGFKLRRGGGGGGVYFIFIAQTVPYRTLLLQVLCN
jgi:hypothetical protein